MKARYTGRTDFPYLTEGKEYEIVSVEQGPDFKGNSEETEWYRVMTDIDEDYLFLPTDFEVTEK